MRQLVPEEDASPIVAFRGFARDISIGSVPCDRRAITLLGWAVSSGSREPEAQHVAALDVACLLGMQPLTVAIGVEHALGQRSGLAAEDAIRMEHVAVAEMREHRRRVEELDILADAAATAPLPGATGVGNEPKAEYAHGIEGLVHLDGDVGAVHHGRHALEAVFAIAAAITGERYVVHDERSAGAIVDSADVGVRPV